MKRTVSEERMPEPLRIYVDSEEVKQEMLDVSEQLSSNGYGEDFMYQVGTVASPVYETGDILDQLSGRFAYATVRGVGEEGVRDEQFTVDHRVEDEDFQEVAVEIDELVDELGYDLDHWQIRSFVDSAQSGSEVVEELDGMEIQATAAVDAGLDSQRGERGFQPIKIGWFYKAPMNHKMQFGYRAFPNREFQQDEDKDYKRSGEELLEDLLGRLTGMRDEEVNNHVLEKEEVDALTRIEHGMQERGLL